MKGKRMNELNFCVAGAGSIGRRHLRLLKERGDIRLSVVEPSEKSWARIVEEMGEFRRFHTLEEALVSGNLDAAFSYKKPVLRYKISFLFLYRFALKFSFRIKFKVCFIFLRDTAAKE